ncbi:MAG: efflux RND transporter periplasmic adaptor subunit [Rhodocyclaceae bacterium]|nr:efflux RND transporter periplasmic adaptor subunit [Rhodocyclaceae bacterium]
MGIEVAAADSASALASAALPARVVVAQDQLRVLAAPVAGMVEWLGPAPGAAVKRGQPLARIAGAQVLELQSGALQAASQLRLARDALARDEQLFAEGLISMARLSASRAAAAQAEALSAERSQGLALAGAKPGRVGSALELLAPADGVVLDQAVQLGQRVEASTLIYRIARTDLLWLEIQAPLALAAAYRLGAQVRTAQQGVRGKLISVGAAVEPGSQSLLLRAQVEQGATALRPGQLVEVQVDAAADGVRLPAAALLRQAGTTLVFVRQGSASADPVSFMAQEVRLLAQSGNSVVVGGLAAGTPVAVKGLSALKAVWTGVGKQ